ncbi:MAG: HAD family hydrolase [Planctomycetota bacterium]
MTQALADIFAAASPWPERLSTGVEPRLPKLPGVRAVVFDVYGTLVVSGSGDIGLTASQDRAESMRAALEAESIGVDAGAMVEGLDAGVRSQHAELKARGVDHPEVEIREVWRAALADAAPASAHLPAEQIERLCVRYESLVNPVGPMPGAAECLETLAWRGLVMGIISNAQFFTPLLFGVFLGKSVDGFGFAPTLRYYSFEHRRAKPGVDLYRMAADGLGGLGVPPEAVLYIGNDMRNDVWPAAAVGFRTALFAGDRRSLRLREDDPGREARPEPDAVVTELAQIADIV